MKRILPPISMMMVAVISFATPTDGKYYNGETVERVCVRYNGNHK